MFDCFEEFEKEGESILKDIGQLNEGKKVSEVVPSFEVRYTNFDTETVDIFQNEFIKRYGFYPYPGQSEKERAFMLKSFKLDKDGNKIEDQKEEEK